jgi:hypothetical protein
MSNRHLSKSWLVEELHESVESDEIKVVKHLLEIKRSHRMRNSHDSFSGLLEHATEGAL